MSKPGKVLKRLCKKLGVRLTVKRGKKRVYKSVKVLKRQCAKKKKKVKKKVKRKRRRRFGSYTGEIRRLYQGSMLPFSEIEKLEKQRRFKENLEGYVRSGGVQSNPPQLMLDNKAWKEVSAKTGIPYKKILMYILGAGALGGGGYAGYRYYKKRKVKRKRKFGQAPLHDDLEDRYRHLPTDLQGHIERFMGPNLAPPRFLRHDPLVTGRLERQNAQQLFFRQDPH